MHLAFLDEMDIGWNPLTGDHLHPATITESKLSLMAAIKFGYDKCGAGDSTKKAYRSTKKHLSKVLRRMGYDSLPIVQVRRKHIRTVMDDAQREFKWTNKPYKRHLGNLKELLSQLVEWDESLRILCFPDGLLSHRFETC